MDTAAPGLRDVPLAGEDEGEWTVVTGHRRRKRQRPAYVPRQCGHCRFEAHFPSRSAFRNHLRDAHGLYLARSGRYLSLIHISEPTRPY